MTRKYQNRRALRTGKWLRVACVVFALLFMLQGYLVMVGILPQTRYMGSGVFFLLVFCGAILAGYSILSHEKDPRILLARTVALEIVAIGLVLTSSGFGSLLSLALILLLYEGYRVYSIKGLILTATVLTLGIILDIYRAIELRLPNIADIIIVVLALVAITVVVSAILRIQGVRQAVLEHSKAQAELERYRVSTLMNNLAQGVLSVDSHGIVRMYNAAALSILDTNGSPSGHHIDEIFKIRDEEGHRVHIFPLMKKSKYTVVHDDLFYKYSDDIVRLEVSITPIRVGKHHARLDIDQGFILLLRDITKQKNLDEERDEFISVVSHELRTPLTIAEGTLSNIEAMYDKGLDSPDRIRPALKAAHEQMVFLSRMVNDLSTLSRAERGVADEVEHIDLTELVNGLYHEYSQSAHSAGLQFNLDTPHKLGSVVASRLYLGELLQNFLTNAIKYTKQGSVTLHATVSRSHVTLAVTDTGIGISKADKEKIFDKFYRSEDYRTRETRGTGLGLHVAKKLAAKLGTTIELKSRLNHGSTFSITLPLEQPEK
ncbi:hypothetical protein GII36_02875 [Candidatus Mycosynbacter amalyticus]|uniref:histidine kinase n=1 Tax=Candidatus Mycosynbacter amalyticus TaxID=2665156 RepID=A0A857MLV2_9BACT|nr:ATP-binding protein [Candidatus Mycosynbacter amalyticus]QHN42785.1 hypothetical protein GII36_02875 [Candidatus Mycosynbacter amalyticus]